jgi:hypothetical protein
MYNVPANIQLLALVGLALSSWSQVERSMTALFVQISRMDVIRAIALFDGIVSFEVRLAILNRLMTFEDLSELDQETWVRLSKRLAKFYKRRHQLAHFGVGGNDRGEWTISPFLTYDNMHEGKRIHLTQGEVSERNGEFVQLSLALD